MNLPAGWTIEDVGCGWVVRDPDGEKLIVTDTKDEAVKAAIEEDEVRRG